MAPSSPFVSFANFHAFALKPLCLPCTHMVLSENTSAPLNNRGGYKKVSSLAIILPLLQESQRSFTQMTCTRVARGACQVLPLKASCVSCVYLIMECVSSSVFIYKLTWGGRKKKQLKDTMSTCKRSCITLVNRYLHCQNVTTNITFLTFIRVMMCYWMLYKPVTVCKWCLSSRQSLTGSHLFEREERES